ncbi:hypothetical protein R5R35_002301 [Gryllus longicercus]|uniref:dTMP kinase n=2 Tax=Gryllus longicercus TaxID=2509291 RepID=A0AAN9VXB4_9ORTH
MMCENRNASEMHVKSVYHSADSILRVLKAEQVNTLRGVEILLKRFNDKFPEGEVNFSNVPRKEVFIVFEGLDGSGKSTIAKEVSKIYKGAMLATPPKSISDIRKIFDGYQPSVRKAYYSLGNYIAAKEILDICEEKPVFLDRFWHSTAAYALAQECDGQQLSSLPSAGDPVYKWPEDLIKPDLVLFLDVTEQTRNIRHARRVKRGETTKEEEQLVKDEAFRNLVLAAYKNMDDIPVVHVDSSYSVKQTVAQCLKHIEQLLPCKTNVDS